MTLIESLLQDLIAQETTIRVDDPPGSATICI
jgi:hypothetical protein